MAEEGQSDIIAFLADGASYGLPGMAVARVETHCSSVFLVGNRAFKLKHPIAFSSVDYTTLERREAACRAELALNRRMAPELYLGIRSIRRRGDGTLGFDGIGDVLDWVVVMRRFDQADLFDRLAEAQRLTPALLTALAEEIAAFHAVAKATPEYGGAEGLRFAIERNRTDLLSEADILGQDAIDSLHARWLTTLVQHAGLLDARRAAGRVRQVHGDLRLANICLLDGRPTLFDAIEFSEALSCIDTLFDLAFLLMELVQRGLLVEAGILFNRYLDVTDDDAGLAALPLMMSLRAATRAYALAGAVKRQPDPGAAQQRRAVARTHFLLASALLDGAEPRLAILAGTPGSPKHGFAERLAATLAPLPGARILSSDMVRRRLLRLPPTVRLPADAYDREMTERVYDRLAAEAAKIIGTGYSAIVEASFVDAGRRRAVLSWPVSATSPPLRLWFGLEPAPQPGEADGWAVVRS